VHCSKCDFRRYCENDEDCIFLNKSNKEIKVEIKKEKAKIRKKNLMDVRDRE